jgi:hypothetical protein
MARVSTKAHGRPAHEKKPHDNERVERMVAFGIPQDQIAAILGISAPTLRKHYADALLTGRSRAVEDIANSLYDTAKAGDVPAQKFFLSARGGWTEKQQTEHSGEVTFTWLPPE